MDDKKVGFLDLMIILAKGKKFILIFTLIASIIAVAYSLLATERWASYATVFPLGDRNAFNMIGTMMEGLGIGLGGSTSPRIINLKNAAVLKSRTNTEYTIHKFNLIEYFKIREKDPLKALVNASRKFHREMLDVLINDETHFMTIRITSKDRELSQKIAQHYLDLLISYSLDTTNNIGRQKRELLERRIDEITESMNTMMNSLLVFQTDQNIIEVERQGRASIEAYQLIIEELIKIDIELNHTERLMPNTPRHRDLILRRDVIIETLSRFESPNPETPFLLPLKDITEHSFTIKEKLFDLELYGKILETLYPNLELARLEEVDNMDRIEIIDLPDIPGRRASPLRALICITTFLAAFLFSSACVLLVSLLSDEDKSKIKVIWTLILNKRES